MRGINVGGKNKVPMADRRQHLEELGFSNGTTYRASGTVMLKSDKRAREITARIENALLKRCTRDDGRIRVEVLTRKHHNAVIDHGLRGFGEQPEHYHSDARFLMGTDSAQAIPVFNPREGVNTIAVVAAEIAAQGQSWPLLQAGLFRGDLARLKEVKAAFDEQVSRFRWR